MIATTSDVVLASLPEHLDKLNPHIVVIMMGINDGHVLAFGTGLRAYQIGADCFEAQRFRRVSRSFIWWRTPSATPRDSGWPRRAAR